MHLLEPVAQRVHDESQRDRVADVQRVPATGRVDVAPRIAGIEAVVRRVVEPAVTQRRARVIGFGGVVEHDVEDDLETRRVQPAHHRLELRDLTAGVSGARRGRVRRMRREVADGVVAPVVGAPGGDDERLGDRVVHGQQLDGRHTEVDEVLHDGVVGESGVGALQLGRHCGVQPRETLRVQLVEDGVRVAVVWSPVAGPVEGGVDHDTAGHRPGRVERARLLGIVHVVAEHCRTERHLAGDRACIRVEQELGLDATDTAREVPRPRRAKAVPQPGAGARHERVPHTRVVVLHRDPVLGAVVLEEAQDHPVGDVRCHREVRALGCRRGAEREGASRPDHRSRCDGGRVAADRRSTRCGCRAPAG